MNDVIFRQYDIRGKVNNEFPIESVYPIGRAIAYHFLQKNPSIKTVAIGADGRTHSPAIKEELCRALQDSGIDVVFIGTCPTPVLYFSLFTLPVQAGIMVTASHNGKEYNGLKICLGKESVWGDQIQLIKKYVHEKKATIAPKVGGYTEHLLIPAYVDWMADQFSHLKNYQIKAVVDCGNGAAGTVLPLLVKKMCWPNVKLLYPDVDGTYPNHEADPTVEKNMLDVKKIVTQTDTQLGIGLDGDCDRMAAMTKTGELVQGDKLLAVFSKSIATTTPGARIIFDVKCSSGLPELLTRWGAVPVMSPSGHSIIKDQMKKHNGLLAGELSCHFFFSDRYFGYDDGIYSMLRLFEIMHQSGKTLDELVTVFPKKYSTREIRLACSEDKKELIVGALKSSLSKRQDAKILTIDGIRVTFPDGWAVVRASNTQPVICLRFEGDTHDSLIKIKSDFRKLLNPFFDEQLLESELNQ
jgi:phosphomannomutase/phosphoglucomutase